MFSKIKLFNIKKNFIFLIIFFSFAINSQEIGQSNDRNIEVLDGDIRENIMIESTKSYMVYHNPTPYAYEAMKVSANEACSKINNDKNFNVNFQYYLGKFSIYFTCETKKETFVYTLTEDEEYYRSQEFIIQLRTRLYDQIKDLEKDAESKISQSILSKKFNKEIDRLKNTVFKELNTIKRDLMLESFFSELNSPKYAKLQKLKIDNILKETIYKLNSPLYLESLKLKININKEICLEYGFIVNSDEYFKCLTSLIDKDKDIGIRIGDR